MFLVLPGPLGDGEPWRVICRTEGRSDVIAQVPRPGSWQDAVARIRDEDGDLDVVRVPDGHYRWVLADEGGQLIAQAPAVYRDARGCRRAFVDARRAARALIGERCPSW